MQRSFIRLIAVLPFVALLAAPAHAGKHDPIYQAEPIQVPAGKGLEDVKKAVRKACFDKEWDVREVGANHLQAKHTKTSRGNTHVAVVDIKYDTKSVRISYKDSQELNYNKDDNTIHGTYNKWIRNLEKNIRNNLGAF